MIFCGDFLFSFNYHFGDTFAGLGESFIKQPKIVNYESTLSYLNFRKLNKGIVLSSSIYSLDALKHLNVKCLVSQIII